MIGPKVSADGGSVSVGGSNTAPIVNAGAGSQVIFNAAELGSSLPSFLGKVIAFFSQQSLSEYGQGPRRDLPPEVTTKVEYNNLPPNHRVLIDYRRHAHILEKSYHGSEQRNDDARYLVRRRAAVAYNAELNAAIKESGQEMSASEFARQNAAMLVEAVIARLLKEYTASEKLAVESEIAHLAVCVVVADAVIECEVLERPPHAATA